MIKNTFLFLPKIKHKKEISLWKQGIKTWEDFLKCDKIKGISKKQEYDSLIREAKKALYENDSTYFLNKLPNNETWRLYDYFKDESVFLDIETSFYVNSYPTIIGLYDGINTKIMIWGINFNIGELKKELLKYKILITFNGASFDLPYLKKRYPELIPKIPSIDLRHLCNKIGLKGGLKQIEEQIGIKRRWEIKLYGDPINLWKKYQETKEEYYLNLLIEYNEEDVINLKKISEYCIKYLRKKLETYL